MGRGRVGRSASRARRSCSRVWRAWGGISPVRGRTGAPEDARRDDGSGPKDGGSDACSGPGDSSTDAGPCVTNDDCVSLLGPLPSSCLDCSGGHEGCEHYICLSGVCQTTYCGAEPTDSASECKTASDCVRLLGPLPPSCLDCSGGDSGCEQYACLSSVCQTTYCGVEPTDSASECETASDCASLLGPLPSFCIECSDHCLGCQHYLCLRGICQTSFCN
jgi:hypothetical protein